nr:hypothetical protein [Sedimentibacter sp.]
MLKDIINATSKANTRLVELMLTMQKRGLSAQEYKELRQLEKIAKDMEKCLDENKEDANI